MSSVSQMQRRPKLLALLDRPAAGLLRAKVTISHGAVTNSKRLVVLLVTVTTRTKSETIGWSCLASQINYHGIDIPEGAKTIVVRVLDPDLTQQDIVLTWLRRGVFGRLEAAIGIRRERGLMSRLKSVENVTQAINTTSTAQVKMLTSPDDVLESLSVLVPSRDQPNLLLGLFQSCFKTVLDCGGEVIIIDHASTLPQTASALTFLRASGCKIVRAEGAFNYSRLVNRAAAAATRARYLILNDDVAPKSQSDLLDLICVDIAASHCIAGPLLMYPHTEAGVGHVQHAGIFLGMGGLAGHWLRHEQLPGPIGVAWRKGARKVDALTGAAVLIDGSLFHALNGYDERYVIECGDIDFCLRAKIAGQSSMLIPTSNWTHAESSSRGSAGSSPFTKLIERDRRRFWLQWQREFAADSHLPKGIDPRVETPRLL